MEAVLRRPDGLLLGDLEGAEGLFLGAGEGVHVGADGLDGGGEVVFCAGEVGAEGGVVGLLEWGGCGCGSSRLCRRLCG